MAIKKISQQGFTLFEILVAILIIGIISVILVTGLQSAVNAKSRVNTVGDQLAQLQMANTIMSKDLLQIVNRSPTVIQPRLGQPMSAALQHIHSNDPLHFVRGGYLNPFAQEKRSSLALVTYHYSEGKLIRSVVLDNSQQNQQALKQTLLTDITSLRWRFLGENHQFYTTWPVPNLANNMVFPKAIELTIETKHMGQFIRLFTINSYGFETPQKQGNPNELTGTGGFAIR